MCVKLLKSVFLKARCTWFGYIGSTSATLHRLRPNTTYRFLQLNSVTLQLNSSCLQLSSSLLQLNSSHLQLNSSVLQLNSSVLQLNSSLLQLNSSVTRMAAGANTKT